MTTEELDRYLRDMQEPPRYTSRAQQIYCQLLMTAGLLFCVIF